MRKSMEAACKDYSATRHLRFEGKVATMTPKAVCLRDVSVIVGEGYNELLLGIEDHAWIGWKEDVTKLHKVARLDDLVSFWGFLYEYKKRYQRTDFGIHIIRNVQTIQEKSIIGCLMTGRFGSYSDASRNAIRVYDINTITSEGNPIPLKEAWARLDSLDSKEKEAIQKAALHTNERFAFFAYVHYGDGSAWLRIDQEMQEIKRVKDMLTEHHKRMRKPM